MTAVVAVDPGKTGCRAVLRDGAGPARDVHEVPGLGQPRNGVPGLGDPLNGAHLPAPDAGRPHERHIVRVRRTASLPLAPIPPVTPPALA
jgi:hypothetical protein